MVEQDREEDDPNYPKCPAADAFMQEKVVVKTKMKPFIPNFSK